MNETVGLLLATRAPKLRKAVQGAKKAGYAYVVLGEPEAAGLVTLADKTIHVLQAREANAGRKRPSVTYIYAGDWPRALCSRGGLLPALSVIW